MIIPVILSGGSGARLWPVSRERYPKQFLSLISGHSLLQETVLRLDALEVETAEPVIVCQEAHGFLVREQLEAIARPEARLVLEPDGRNTAPAVAVAGLLLEQLYPGTNPSLMVLPADHMIRNPERFAESVSVAQNAAEQGFLVTFGIVPSRPETGYGYIKRGEQQEQFFHVDSFVEKPDIEEARRFQRAGDHYWNSGMFMFKAASYLAELERFAPEILSQCRQAVEQSSQNDLCMELGREAFLACPKDSIDYAVMEHTAKAVVTPMDAGWSDVGSWASLYDVSSQDERGNVLVGDVLALDCRDSYVHATDRLIACVGLDELIVVDSSDALLVMPKSRSQDLRDVVEELKTRNRPEVSSPAQDRFPWGSRQVLEKGESFEVYRLEVRPGACAGLQEHDGRTEHWVVVSGTVSVTGGKEPIRLGAGESTLLPADGSHQIENPGEAPATIVAVVSRSRPAEEGTQATVP